MKIFIVEDDVVALRDMKKQISPFFHAIFSASSYTEALTSLSNEQFDCIICDHHLGNLEEKHGLQLIKKLRENGNQTPIILLTGRSLEEISPWEALNSGVDDFIKKPCDPIELVARVRAVYRRCFHCEKNATNILTYKNISLDIENKKVFIRNQELKLRKIPFLILQKFLETPRSLVRYEVLIEYIWGDAALFSGQSINSLRVHVCALKQVLAEEYPHCIVNTHGMGYIFDEKK